MKTHSFFSSQSTDQNTKFKCIQISEAYKKLISVMEGKDQYNGDDSQEIAAFMRMFMDMVGISESDSIPAGLCFLSSYYRFTKISQSGKLYFY